MRAKTSLALQLNCETGMRVQQANKLLLFDSQINYQVRSLDRVANLADLFDVRFDEMGARSLTVRSVD